MARLLATLAVVTTVWLAPCRAQAATAEHVVVRGETLGSIAKHYGTSVRAIEQMNGLKPGRFLYPGQKLLVPGVRRVSSSAKRKNAAATPSRPPAQASAPKAAGAEPKKASKEPAAAARRKGLDEPEENEPDEGDNPWVCSKSSAGRIMALPRTGKAEKNAATRYERKPSKPGVVTLKRYGETFRGRLADDSGKLSSASLEKITHLMRDLRTRRERPIDERLLQQLVRVSDHFGGRTIIVVSGYREYTPNQHTRTSRHNVGQAVDFRVVGVPVEVVWDYCLSLGKVGVGYYPTSQFVHLDVRGYDAAWVDTSRPGERPTYACRPAQPESSEAQAKQSKAPTPKRSRHAPPSAERPSQPKDAAKSVKARSTAGSTRPKRTHVTAKASAAATASKSH